VLHEAAGAAVLAPSAHNTQPWRFRIIGNRLEVLSDPERHLTVLDRDRRQQIQSLGCALFNARIAVRASGFAEAVETFPDSRRPELVAVLALGMERPPTELDRQLMTAIPRRRTNRRPFLPRPVAASDTDRLAAAVDAEGAWLVRLIPAQKHRLGRLVDEADQLQLADPAFRDELGRWLRPFGSRRKDGIPFSEKEYGSALPFTLMRTLRSPGLGAEFGQMEEQLLLGSPVVAVLGTEGDEPADWLAAGQGLQAILLRATAAGMSASFLNQVLELPPLRLQVADLLDRGGFPQQVLRIGFAEDEVHHPAPRRDLDEVLEIVY
jgi:hypothetical protein